MKKLFSLFAYALILSSTNFASGSHHNKTMKQQKNYKKFILDTAHTTIGFSVRHMVISNVKGKFSQFEGMIKVDDKNKLHSLDLKMQSSSVTTDNVKRDEHLKSKDFFDAKVFPELKFWSTKIVELGKNEYQVIGNFTMKGVTKTVSLIVELSNPIKDPWGNTRIGASAKGKLNRRDYGLNFNKIMDAGGLLVGDQIKLEIEMESIQIK